MTTEQLQAWLDDYLVAWRTYDADKIEALFSEDATYAYHPWDEPIRGRDAIVADWLKDPDDPDRWEADYRPLGIDGDRAFATGQTRYRGGNHYWNIFEMRFDSDGRCAEFVEWFMVQP